MLFIVVLLGGANTCGRGEPTAPAAFHEVAVGRLPAGSDPDQIGLIDCDDCGELCSGAPFLGADGTVYFYESRPNNLKMLRAGSSEVMVIAGPRVTARNAQPIDGAVSPDGTIYLLADRGTTTQRYRIYVRAPSEAGWRAADSLDDPDIGWTELSRKRVTAHGSIRIDISPRGAVEVFDFDRRSSAAIVVGDEGGVRRADARIKLPPGAVGRLNHTIRRSDHTTVVAGAEGTRVFSTSGVFLGTDARDNLYFRAPGPADGVDLLRRYGPEGRLLAEGTVPARPIASLLLGKGTFQLAPEGDIYQFRMTPKGLEVTRWTTENQP